MKKHRILAILLSVVMTVSVITGCSASDSSDDASSQAQADDELEIGSIVVYGKGEQVRGLAIPYVTFETGKRLAEEINSWKREMGDSVNVYAMPIPLSSQFYMPDSMKGQGTDQHENIKNIIGNLKGVVGINCVSELEQHVNEDIYARTDHHWLPLGAYYGAKVFAQEAQVDYPPLDQYDKFTKEGFVGTYYTYSNYDKSLEQHPDTFVYFKPKNIKEVSCTYYNLSFTQKIDHPKTDESGMFIDSLDGSKCYSVFFGGDAQMQEIKTSCTNNRVLVIFKNSYANAMVPFLTNSFSKIYVCDYRFFETNGIDFCKKVGCTDLLFAGVLPLICSDVGIGHLERIRVKEGKNDSNEEK